VCLEGFQKADGKDISFTTKNPDIIAQIEKVKKTDKVNFGYKEVTNAKGYQNYYIETVTILESVPF